MTRDLASTICIGRGEALTIGVRVQSGVARLHGTLAAPRANSGRPVRLVLLPDGPDEEMIGVLRGMREPQLPTQDERGAGDCLARLVAAAETPIVAFLESGALVGPEWLDRLLAALEREPAAALVGPSTRPVAVERRTRSPLWFAQHAEEFKAFVLSQAQKDGPVGEIKPDRQMIKTFIRKKLDEFTKGAPK